LPQGILEVNEGKALLLLPSGAWSEAERVVSWKESEAFPEGMKPVIER